MKYLICLFFLTLVESFLFAAPQNDPVLENIVITKPDVADPITYVLAPPPLFLMKYKLGLRAGAITGKYHSTLDNTPLILGGEFHYFDNQRLAHSIAIDVVGSSVIGLNYNRKLFFMEEEVFRPMFILGLYNATLSKDGIAGLVNIENIQIQLGGGFEWQLSPLFKEFNTAESFIFETKLGLGTEGTSVHLNLGYHFSW